MQENDDRENVKASLKGMLELMTMVHEKLLKIEADQERQKFDRIVSESINSLSQGSSRLQGQYTRAQNSRDITVDRVTSPLRELLKQHTRAQDSSSGAITVDRATSPFRELPTTKGMPRKGAPTLGVYHLSSFDDRTNSDATSTMRTLDAKNTSMDIGNTSSLNIPIESLNHISKDTQIPDLEESSKLTQQTHLLENNTHTINPAIITKATLTKSLPPEIRSANDTNYITTTTATPFDTHAFEKQADTPDTDSLADRTVDLPELFPDLPAHVEDLAGYLRSSPAFNATTSSGPSSHAEKSPARPAETDDAAIKDLAVSSSRTTTISSSTPFVVPPKRKYKKRKPRYIDYSLVSVPKVLRSGTTVSFINNQEMSRKKKLAKTHNTKLAQKKNETLQAQQQTSTTNDESMTTTKKDAGFTSLDKPTDIGEDVHTEGASTSRSTKMEETLAHLMKERQLKRKELRLLKAKKVQANKDNKGVAYSNRVEIKVEDQFKEYRD